MFPYGNSYGIVNTMKRRFLNTPEAVAMAVRDTRREMGLSQAQLAHNAGVGRRFIVDVEAGHHRAELGKVLDVLNVLDIHAMALPGPEITRTFMDVDLDKLLRNHA